jgi:hypothetical protein
MRSDPLVVKKYPWGTGITQRIVGPYIGAGTGPDEVEYDCRYFGLIVGETSIKLFTLSASGIETLAEADQWAQNPVSSRWGRILNRCVFHIRRGRTSKDLGKPEACSQGARREKRIDSRCDPVIDAGQERPNDRLEALALGEKRVVAGMALQLHDRRTAAG